MFFILGIMTSRRIQNPKHLTPAEKGKAKVNEYEEFSAEIQQKIPQRIEFLNSDHTNSIILEEVLQTSAKFLGDNSTNYPIHIQILLDNLTRAFIENTEIFMKNL
jgi:predicted transcriptional regulator